MTSTSRNGTGKMARKSLAEQIDRLDATLDGLADNLNEAVAAAVKDAVQNVLVEVLTNPDLANLMRNTANPVQPATSETSHRSGGTSRSGRQGILSRGWTATRLALHVACGSVGLGLQQLAQTCRALVLKAWNGCRTFVGLVCNGVAWLWSRIKVGTTKAATLVSRGVMAAVGSIRNAFAAVCRLAVSPVT